MSEKTEKPSQHRLKKAREKGEIAFSAELTSALVLLGGLLILWGLAPFFQNRLKTVFTSVYSGLNRLDLQEAWNIVVTEIAWPLTAILGGIFLIALMSHFLQIGWIWHWKKGKKKGKGRFLYTPFKVAAIAAVGYFSFQKMPLATTPGEILEGVFLLLLKVAIALVVIGLCDLFYQKWKFFQSMHMTHQEAKEERRETDGDQQIKQKMRKR